MPSHATRHTSSYDNPEEYISVEQYRKSMRLVRLQIAVPISVLVSLATALICALVIKPNIAGVSKRHPTLMTPNSSLLGLYWLVLFALQIGFCLILIVTRSEQTKDALIHGVGLRFAIANWVMAAWTVCWTLQVFQVAEILLLVNVLILLTIVATLSPFKPRLSAPFDFLFIHVNITMFFAVLLEVMWMHNGFIAMGWVIKDEKRYDRWQWYAVGCLVGVNVVVAIWEFVTRWYVMMLASEYLIATLLFSTVRVIPDVPTAPQHKPLSLIITLFSCLALHPVALMLGVVWRRSAERLGRIRLEEEAENAEEREREAEIQAEVEARIRAREQAGDGNNSNH